MASIQIIMGGEQVGGAWNQEKLKDLADALESHGVTRIETAPLYSMASPGSSERLLGEADFPQKFTIDTKIKYNYTGGGGTLAADAVKDSIAASIEALRVGDKKLDTLYVHGPDRTTPLSEQAATLDAHHKRGDFKQLGICNLDPSTVVEWLRIADEKGYVKPSFYQGQYNILCRTYEETLFPVLRKSNIPFVASSPLAGGFLTGKFTFSKEGNGDKDLEGTRWHSKDPHSQWGKYWYDKPSFHEAIKKISAACQEKNISLVDAALRWELFHSGLRDGDAVVIGPTSVKQLNENFAAIKGGKLPADLAGIMEDVWSSISSDAASVVQL